MHHKNSSKLLIVLLTAAGLVAMFLYSLQLGAANINVFEIIPKLIFNPSAIEGNRGYIFLQVRLPRIVLCMLTGISLGLSGCIMQNLLRNPLVSPFTLGVSSGASFGAALAMVFGAQLVGTNLYFSGYPLVGVFAFAFGTLSLIIVLFIAKIAHHSITVLILSGVAISSLFSAGVSILKYVSSAETLQNLDIWLMGGFWASNWSAVMTLLPFIVLCIIFVYRHAWDFNALNAGEDIAATLGVSLKKLKYISLTLVTLIASISIAFSGVIGFIGLMSPHIARSLTGSDNRYLIIASSLIGGLVLLVADTVARTLISPREIPVGIITALIGVPIFMFILFNRQKKIWRRL